MPAKPRVVWLAGTRNEVLRLGPLFQGFYHPRGQGDGTHWFALTGEQATAAHQAVDYVELYPHETFELRHPAEDPAQRLQGVMAEVEAFIRRRRATHVVFTGYGPTAAASALVCHARRRRGLWIRPSDPAGLIARLHWERGLFAVVESLQRNVEIVHATAAAAISEPLNPEPRSGEPESARPTSTESATAAARQSSPFGLIAGRRQGVPLVLIALSRALWGMGGVFDRLVRAADSWARLFPQADWLVLRTLDARLEGPLRSLPDRPPNLLGAPPLPYPEYAALLGESSAVLTDSCHIAAEAMASKVPLLAFGEEPGASQSPGASMVHHMTPDDWSAEEVQVFLQSAVDRSREANVASPNIWTLDPNLRTLIKVWMQS